MLAGLAIKPDTNLNDNIFDLLDRNLFDMVLVMTVGIFFISNFLIYFDCNIIRKNNNRTRVWWVKIYDRYDEEGNSTKKEIPLSQYTG